MKYIEPQFQFVDETGFTRLVEIIINYNEDIGLDRRTGFADVRDLATGHIIERVPLTSLAPFHP